MSTGKEAKCNDTKSFDQNNSRQWSHVHVHDYNKDDRHNHQLSGDTINFVLQIGHVLVACCKKMKTTKLLPCKQHTLHIHVVNNTKYIIYSAISCCFFSEYCIQSSNQIIDNEHLYVTGDRASQISSYVSMHEL